MDLFKKIYKFIVVVFYTELTNFLRRTCKTNIQLIFLRYNTNNNNNNNTNHRHNSTFLSNLEYTRRGQNSHDNDNGKRSLPTTPVKLHTKDKQKKPVRGKFCHLKMK